MKKFFAFFLIVFCSTCTYQNHHLTQAHIIKLSKDIPVPEEMKIIPDDSCTVKVLSHRVRYLSFKGRITARSLFDYYMVFMRKNNWHLKNYINCKKSLLVFEKFPRTCVILIDERAFYTYLSIFELKDINFLKNIPIQEKRLTR